MHLRELQVGLLLLPAAGIRCGAGRRGGRDGSCRCLVGLSVGFVLAIKYIHMYIMNIPTTGLFCLVLFPSALDHLVA